MHLSPPGWRPGGDVPAVETLEGLIQAVENDELRSRVLPALGALVQAGYLERWLADAVDSPAMAAAVRAVRGDATIPERAKPLVVCLRLGMRKLPLRRGIVAEKFADLATLLDVPSGRELLHEMLEGRVLESWAEVVRPGAGDIVAATRALPREFAVDRAVRILCGPEVYLVPGVRAGNFAALSAIVDRCVPGIDAPPVQARIRDALHGPIRLPGAPGGPARSPLAQPPHARGPSLLPVGAPQALVPVRRASAAIAPVPAAIAPVAAPGAQLPALKKQNPLATAGFVCALLGLTPMWIGFILCILGITFSAVGLSNARRLDGAGRALAVWGLILGILFFVPSMLGL